MVHLLAACAGRLLQTSIFSADGVACASSIELLEESSTGSKSLMKLCCPYSHAYALSHLVQYEPVLPWLQKFIPADKGHGPSRIHIVRHSP